MKTNYLTPLQWGKRTLMAFSLLLALYACNSNHEKTSETSDTPPPNNVAATKTNKKRNIRDYKDQRGAAPPTSSLAEDAPPPKNLEKKPVNDNTFLSVKTAPLSTFSIDVDNASYSRARKSINNGQLPNVGSVRVEEFINYFKYQYKQPKGKHPFSVNTEVAKCPWNPKNHLVHIGLQGKRLDNRKLKPSNLVFLIDVSGSMNAPDKLPLLRKAFKMLVNNLGEEDRVAIVAYAGNAGLVLPATQGTDKQKIMEALDRLQLGGSTAGGAGIKLAYKIAKQNFIKEGNNRIILATDGDFNVGASSDQAMQSLIEEKRKEGVFITVLGLGMGNYRDSKMEIIADKGNGNYYYLDNLNEAYKVFGKDLKGTLFTIAKDVKIQVEFNPSIVKSYRLIGYENRLLANRDFRDDTKDAGEIGAGHTVTALYEVTLHSNPQTVAVDQDQIPANFQATQFNNQQLMNVRLRYKKPEGNTGIETNQIITTNHQSVDETSNNFRFSAAVASFGMLLKNSQHKGSSTFQTVLTLAKGAKGKDKNQYRVEFIDLVQKASQITTQ
ncbi:VWA domain-containing protein [uncultured Microscilla sp.]|uniref:vWA domain-containing protein n=1 Tax=uncultured Microscilla sp. TaxID=432653 RepID=UPI00260D2630|nr:VWA domain-containing protein [uncultured Microscilla sp.]